MTHSKSLIQFSNERMKDCPRRDPRAHSREHRNARACTHARRPQARAAMQGSATGAQDASAKLPTSLAVVPCR